MPQYYESGEKYFVCWNPQDEVVFHSPSHYDCLDWLDKYYTKKEAVYITKYVRSSYEPVLYEVKRPLVWIDGPESMNMWVRKGHLSWRERLARWLLRGE